MTFTVLYASFALLGAGVLSKICRPEFRSIVWTTAFILILASILLSWVG